jgi:hypothetical protein
MPVMAGLEASSLWGQWRLAFNRSVADPLARAVTPEQALLDLEVMAAVRTAVEPQTTAEWMDEQEARYAALDREQAARMAADLPEGLPSIEEGNTDPEAAFRRLMALTGRDRPMDPTMEPVSLEG